MTMQGSGDAGSNSGAGPQGLRPMPPFTPSNKPASPLSSWTMKGEAVDPVTARGVIEGRQIPPIVDLNKLSNQGVKSLAAGDASGTIEGPASISELARALGTTAEAPAPQKMFKWVNDNVDFTPTFGLQKGAYGCLLDGYGNSFDQSALLIALLRQAGYTANYVQGTLQLTLAQCQAWFGTDNNIFTASALCSDGGIPNTVVGTWPNQQLQMSHCWVQVNVGTPTSPNWVVMDPSFKSYNVVTGINLATAMGYSQAAFISSAETGATIDPSGNWVQNINSANVATGLTSYATSLISYIRANNPTATLDNILGGRQIVQQTVPFTYLTALPYEMPGDVPTIWTGDVPTSYKVSVSIDGSQVGWNAPGSPLNFTSDQIYGQRFTVFYNSSNQPILSLAGTVIATGTAQGYGTWAALTFTVTHNAYPITNYNQTFYQQINAITSATGGTTYYYLIGSEFGSAGKGLLDAHQRIFAANSYSGGQFSEPVMGEMLMTLWATYSGEQRRIADLLSRMTNCTSVLHHQIGMTIYSSSSTFSNSAFDIEGYAGSITSLVSSGTPLYTELGTSMGMHGYGLEQLAIQQVTGLNAACASRILHVANAAGTKIYKGTQANWNGTVVPALSGYSTTDLNNIYTYWLSYGWDVWISQTATQTLDSVTGYGWAFVTPGAASGIIYTFKGGSGTQNGDPWNPDVPEPLPDVPPMGDPINSQSGAYLYQHDDLSIGSSVFPYQLSFQSKYDSSQRYVLGPLGYGWKHNWDITASPGSDAFEGYGLHSPISAAATIAEMYVAIDLLTSNISTLPVDIIMVLTECNIWWIAQQTKNVVSISTPDGGYTYALLPDGTYKAPPNCPNTLSLSGGAYTVTTPQQAKLNFNTAGQLSTWVLPNGMTLTLTYSSGLLQTISNGLTRTLTLSYTGNLVTGVSDGTGRSVSYSFDSNNQLTAFTDALSHQTSFTYNLPGQMISYFLPQNPSNALLTNFYDTLGRVSSQNDAYGNTRSFYLANSRSEFVDPNLNSEIAYFDLNGNIVKHIDQLGNVALFTFDGLGRLSTFTLPEGNSIQWSYDNSNSFSNLLTKTFVPKPGSSLTSIVLHYTSDANYNKIHTFQDGNGNTWTYNYDSSTGNLLSAVGPTVGGLTPQKTYTYNSRGQVLTYTDETGIVTQYNYDGTTEKQLSVIVDYGTTPHLNLTTSYAYDSVGNISSITDPNSNQTTYQSDALRRVIQKTDPTPFNYITNYSYDKNSNQTAVQRQTGGVAGTPAWQTYSYGYTVTNKLATITDPANNTTVRTFDNFDRLWTSTDAQNCKTTFAYDARSMIYTVTDPSNTISETRLYSNNNRLASIKDANSNLTQYTRDGFDRLDKTIYADSSFSENFAYDGNNNVLTYYTRSGNTVTYTWDVLNRLSTKSPQGEATATYQYDLHGRKTSSSTPIVSGNPATGTFNFYYDSAGRFYKESTPGSLTTTFQLDSNGNVTQVTYPDGYYVKRSFDQLNRLTNLYLNGAVSPAVTIVYDQLSRRQSLTFNNGVVVSYAFQLNNDLAELDQAFVSSAVSFSYTYNNVHQETARGASDAAYVWHPPSASTITYGPANNVNQYPSVGGTTYTYDGNANLKSNGTWTFTFDTKNQTHPTHATGTSVSYVYDADHRQIQKTIGSTQSLYVYSGWQRIADYNGATNVLQTRYVYGDRLDEPLIAISSAGVLTYLHADKLGSIVATTNSSGNVTNKNTYSQFGESASVSGTTFGFTGQRFDSDTGLYYCKRRYYSPLIGRYLQTDPILFAAGLNLYTYCSNDPLNLVDPMGLTPDWWWSPFVVVSGDPADPGWGSEPGNNPIIDPSKPPDPNNLPKGTQTYRNSDGSTTYIFPDGSYVTVRADRSYVVHGNNGDTKYYDKSGDLTLSARSGLPPPTLPPKVTPPDGGIQPVNPGPYSPGIGPAPASQ